MGLMINKLLVLLVRMFRGFDVFINVYNVRLYDRVWLDTFFLKSTLCCVGDRSIEHFAIPFAVC